jgi:hypothetical protein
MRGGERGGADSRRRSAAAAASVLAAALFAGAAAAASPTATTGPTTAVGSTTATVTGTVDAAGQSTTWHVEYGTSTAYGSKTASTAVSGTGAASVSANLAGLEPGATYHYRVVATSGAVTSRGGDAVFTTLVPPAATTAHASSISASTATLNGTVDANGRATTYFFEYGTSTSYGTRTTARSAGTSTSAQPASTGVSGLRAGRTYHFRVVATSDAGTSTGKDVSFRTSSVPAAVTAAATSLAPTSAVLHGTVTPNGLSTRWWFEYGTSTGYGARTPAHGAGSGAAGRSVSATIRNLKIATAYHYRLVAQNSSGRTYGSDQTLTTVGPPATQTGTAQGVGADTALLTGSLDPRSRSTTWWFEYGGSTQYGRSTPTKSVGTSAGAQTVSFTLTGLAAAAVYHYRLVAKSDAGKSYGADATFTTAGVTIAVTARAVVFGGRIELRGLVPTHQAGEQVVVFAQPYGGGSFRSVATVLSDAAGTWVYLARPPVATTYEARWRDGMSAQIAVGVHPKLLLKRTRSGRLVVSALGGRSFANRYAQLQRRLRGRWKTIRRVRLGAHSRAEVRLRLPKGRWAVRATFSVNQAGLGYLGSTSRVLRIARR